MAERIGSKRTMAYRRGHILARLLIDPRNPGSLYASVRLGNLQEYGWSDELELCKFRPDGDIGLVP